MNASEQNQNSFKAGETLKCTKCKFELKVVTACNCDQGAPQLTCCGQPLVGISGA